MPRIATAKTQAVVKKLKEAEKYHIEDLRRDHISFYMFLVLVDFGVVVQNE